MSKREVQAALVSGFSGLIGLFTVKIMKRAEGYNK